jgi:hypothetical protein
MAEKAECGLIIKKTFERKNIMLCAFCYGREEFQYKGKKSFNNHDEEINSFVCSRCVQKLLQIPQEKLIKAHYLALEKGYSDKAFWLENLIDENVEVLHVQETRKARPDMVGKRPMRPARSSRHQVRS